MALSTLRFAMRPCLQQSLFLHACAPMATSAHNEMKEFWQKNQKLNRPSAPWIIYRPHLPMFTSLTHRTTGVIMGVVLYGASIAMFLAPGDATSYIEFIKNLHLSPALLLIAKGTCAFPLIYHYINGIRHLTWDTGRGFELSTQYKSGWTILGSSVALSLLVGSIAYW